MGVDLFVGSDRYGNSVTGGNDHLSGNDDADGYSFMMSMVLSVGRKENGKSPFRL